MQWNDSAILLSTRKHGESSAVLRVFSRIHGVYAGVARGMHSKANRGIFQPGNVVSATWNARLSEQLGNFKLELLTPYAAHIMPDGARLAALSSACTLLESALPERHAYTALYDHVLVFLEVLATSNDWPEAYVRLELEILSQSGFGLDLTECAGTGKTEDLIYVSPKSGRAVSREAGAPYHDKLLPLPQFLLPYSQKNRAEPAEILEGLQLTGYFLGHWLLEPHGRKLPAARQRLHQKLKAPHATETTDA